MPAAARMAEAIHFARSLYSPEAVEAAIEAWQGVAQFDVEQLDQAIAVRMEPNEGDPEEAKDTFSNHVLFETIVRSRPGEER